jgi:hypothetical protein
MQCTAFQARVFPSSARSKQDSCSLRSATFSLLVGSLTHMQILVSVNPLKSSGNSAAATASSESCPKVCISVSCDSIVNVYYFHKQHYPVDLCYGYGLFSLRCRLKFYV